MGRVAAADAEIRDRERDLVEARRRFGDVVADADRRCCAHCLGGTCCRRAAEGLWLAGLVLSASGAGCADSRVVRRSYQGAVSAGGVAFFTESRTVRGAWDSDAEEQGSIVMCSPRVRPVCVRIEVEELPPQSLEAWMRQAAAPACGASERTPPGEPPSQGGGAAGTAAGGTQP